MNGDADAAMGRWRIPVLGVAAAVFFFGVWSLPLQEPDEGRYGDIAASMTRTGDWLTPRSNGLRYFEKPPLYFWLAAASVAVLGPTEAAVRLPSAIACLATVILLMRWGRRVGGPRVEVLAGAFAGTLPLVALFSHMAMVDLVLTFLVARALYSAWRGLFEPEDRPRRGWILGFWGACGLAMLTKGPVGVAIPLAAVVAALAFCKLQSRFRALAHPYGLLVFALVCAPWFAAMEAANPGYLREFFLEQNYSRAVAGEVFNRNAPAWHYLPLIVLYFLPWVLLVPAAFRKPSDVPRESRLRIFLACAVAVPFVLLSAAQSKLGYYLLPLAPPVALLAALGASKIWAPGERRGAVAMAAAAGFCFGLGGLAAYASTQSPEQLNAQWGRQEVGPERKLKGRDYIAHLQRQAPWAVTAAALAGVGAAVAAGLARFGKPTESLLAAAFSLAILEIGVIAIGSRLPPMYTARDIAARLRSSAGAGEPILLFEEYMTSIPFYLQRPVTLPGTTFPMFGHTVTDEEAKGLSLQDRPEGTREFLAGHDSALVVCRTPDGERAIHEAGAGRWTLIGREGRYSIWRHRRRESPLPDEGDVPAGR